MLFEKEKEKKYVDVISSNILRVYKKKNDTSLFELNLTHDAVPVAGTADTLLVHGFTVGADNLNNIYIEKDGRVYFSEYSGKDTTIYKVEQDWDLAMLEGHAAVQKEVDFKTQINLKLFGDEDRIYGLGDKAAQLNRRDYEYVSWNSDDPTQHNETYRSLYKSINFILVNHSKDMWYGVFYPSSYKCTFNLGRYNKNFMYIGSEKGEYDYFVFLGKTPREVVSAYYSLIGKQLLTSIKFLGNHQSRWSYTEAEADELVRRHVEEKMPLDYIHFDIDYMRNYRVYTVDDKYIKDFAATTKKYKESGVGVITIIDPAVKFEKGYGLHDEMSAKGMFATLDGKEYVNAVWPGDSKYPNYFSAKTRDFLKTTTMDFLNKYGVTGIWCDMNEPASFNGPLPDDVVFKGDDGKEHLHEEVHNLYGEYMAKTIASVFTEQNLRPSVITRAAFATTSKYTTSWNGDNQSLWDHLRTSLPQLMTMNICGHAMNSVDVAGFGNDTTKELAIRWVEGNIFIPYFRNHSCKNSRYQEPYAFDEETYNIYRKYLELRYEFIPYLYDLQWKAHETGEPMYAPLFYYYPDDEKVMEINDEVMVGELILHAPILNQGQKERVVYFPEGRWIDYLTGDVYDGQKSYIVECPLDYTGIFVKEGALIPQYKGVTSINKKNIDTLLIYVARGKEEPKDGYIPYVHHEDDGESLDYEKGVYNEYLINFDQNLLRVKKIKNDYRTDYKQIILK